MSAADPRVWALRHPRQTLFVLIILISVLVVGNVLLSRGGMFDGEVIVQTEDPWREMDRYVQQKTHAGFDSEETIAFFVNGAIHSPSDLERTLALTDAVKTAFGDGVMSLSTIPAYQDDGEALDDTPYLTADLLRHPNVQSATLEGAGATRPERLWLVRRPPVRLDIRRALLAARS